MGHCEASPPLWVSRAYKVITQVQIKAQAEVLGFQVSLRKDPVGVNSGMSC